MLYILLCNNLCPQQIICRTIGCGKTTDTSNPITIIWFGPKVCYSQWNEKLLHLIDIIQFRYQICVPYSDLPLHNVQNSDFELRYEFYFSSSQCEVIAANKAVGRRNTLNNTFAHYPNCLMAFARTNRASAPRAPARPRPLVRVKCV